MGRYFSIYNATKNHYVSEGESCWKGFEFCECHAVMHLGGWDKTDVITTGCYDTQCELDYDPETNMMKLFINSKPWQWNLPVSPLDEVNPGDDINNLIEKPVEKSYEFSTSGMKEETYRHVPVWTITENGEKICSLCLYKFNPDSLENKRKMVLEDEFS